MICVVLLVAAASVAEIMAIRGAIDAAQNELELRYVVFVIVLATIVMAIRTIVPWASQLGRLPSARAAILAVVAVVAVVAVSVATQLYITRAIDRADKSQTVTTAWDQLDSAVTAYNAALSQSETATAGLLDDLQSVDVRAGGGLGHATIGSVVSFVSSLDTHIGNRLEMDTITEVNRALAVVAGVLDDGRTFLNPVSLELLRNGVEEMADDLENRIGALDAVDDARFAYTSACRAAPFTGCSARGPT